MKHSHQNPIARRDDKMARLEAYPSDQERFEHPYTGGRPAWMEEVGRPTEHSLTPEQLKTIKHSVGRKRRQHEQVVINEEMTEIDKESA